MEKLTLFIKQVHHGYKVLLVAEKSFLNVYLIPIGIVIYQYFKLINLSKFKNNLKSSFCKIIFKYLLLLLRIKEKRRELVFFV